MKVIFEYRSSEISVKEWFAILTLCLAPLFAHVLVGVPEPVLLSNRKLRFIDRLPHYNPTSIFWRNFAIADRRIRAKDWNAADMAASNAHFWTKDGWDGSEDMLLKSRVYCKRLPSGTRISFLSTSAAKTLLVTLQGVQAIYALIDGQIPGDRLRETTALDSIYFPFAVLGLLRLFASLWLSEDWAFSADGVSRELHRETIPLEPVSSKRSEDFSDPQRRVAHQASTSYVKSPFDDPSEFERTLPSARSTLLSAHHPGYFHDVNRFHPQLSLRGLPFRILYLILGLGLLVLAIFNLIPFSGHLDLYVWTATGLVTSIFYTFFLSFSVLTFAMYCFRQKGATTVIPCISSTWYRIYTYCIFLGMAVVFVIAAIETRISPCGKYSVFPPEFDGLMCEGVLVAQNYTIYTPNAIAVSNAGAPGVALYEWTGWCSGKRDNDFAEVVYRNGSQSVRVYDPPIERVVNLEDLY